MTRPRKKGQPHKGWKDSARKTLRNNMTDTIVNNITLPLSDEDAKKLAAIPQGTASHTHTFSEGAGEIVTQAHEEPQQ